MTSMTLNRREDNYLISAILKGEPKGNLINRIPGSRTLKSNLPASALRMLDVSRGPGPHLLKSSLHIGRAI